MILNIGVTTGEHLLLGINMLVPVDASVLAMRASILLQAIRAEKDPHVKHDLIRLLQHLGVVKHRLEAGLWMPDPFPGPHAWGYPMPRQERLGK